MTQRKKEHHKMDFYVRSVDEVEEITGMDFFHHSTTRRKTKLKGKAT